MSGESKVTHHLGEEEDEEEDEVWQDAKSKADTQREKEQEQNDLTRDRIKNMELILSFAPHNKENADLYKKLQLRSEKEIEDKAFLTLLKKARKAQKEEGSKEEGWVTEDEVLEAEAASIAAANKPKKPQKSFLKFWGGKRKRKNRKTRRKKIKTKNRKQIKTKNRKKIKPKKRRRKTKRRTKKSRHR